MPQKAEDPADVAKKAATKQRIKEDSRHPVPDLTPRPWKQSQPRDQKTTMEVNMLLREVQEAADGLCIRACAFTEPDDARAALHTQYMQMIDVTHPSRVLNSGPPQLPDTADNAHHDFPEAGHKRATAKRLDTKMCSMILKAITDPEFNQHLPRIANDATKPKGRRASWLIHEISCKLEADLLRDNRVPSAAPVPVTVHARLPGRQLGSTAPRVTMLRQQVNGPRRL